MRSLAYYAQQYYRETVHQIRLRTSTAYADSHALAMDAEAQAFLRECRTNDWAHLLRERGYDVPVGTVLFGVPVTR